MSEKVNWVGSWIWTQDDGKSRNYYCYARGVFHYKKNLEYSKKRNRVVLNITADSCYKLYFNGVYIGRGPVRSDPRWQYYDSFDITDYVDDGKNIVAVIVHHYGVKNALAINTRGGLLCQVEEICDESSNVLLKTDNSWRITRAIAWKQEVPQVNPRQDFIEIFESRKEPSNWYYKDFEDSTWQSASLIGLDGLQSASWISQDLTYPPTHCVRPWDALVPRDIPHLTEQKMYPVKIADKGEVFETSRQPGQLLNPAVQIASDINMELLNCKLINIENLLVQNSSEPAIIENWIEPNYVGCKLPGRDTNIKNTYIVLDFGKQVNGYFHIKIKGIDGGIIDIGYGQSLINNRVYPLFRGNRGDRYIMRDGVQEWETFMWKSFRYVQLTFRNIHKPVKIYEANIIYSTYPVNYKGAFECSDVVLTKMWEVARYTCQLCMMDAFMDNPSDELRQYIQTGRILALVSYTAFGDYMMAKKMLKQVSQSQKSDGCIQVAWPDGHAAERLNVDFVDGPLMYIQAVWEYYMYSGDKELLRQLYPSLVNQISWFEKFLDDDGFVCHIPCPIWIDHADLNRNGKVAIVNAWFYSDLIIMQAVAKELNDTERFRKYEQMAHCIQKAYHEKYWDSEKDLYVDSVLLTNKSDKASEHTNAITYLYNLGDMSRFETVIKSLYSNSKRTVMASPLFQFFIIDAWCQMKRSDLAIGLLKSRFEGLIAEGVSTFGTMWSTKGPHVVCQSESSSPVYLLTTHVLGIKPIKPGFEEFNIYPCMCGLEWARGNFPSIKGDIVVDWTRNDTEFKLKITVPHDTICYVGIPLIEHVIEKISLNGSYIWKDGIYIDKTYKPKASVIESERIIFKVCSGTFEFIAETK